MWTEVWLTWRRRLGDRLAVLVVHLFHLLLGFCTRSFSAACFVDVLYVNNLLKEGWDTPVVRGCRDVKCEVEVTDL